MKKWLSLGLLLWTLPAQAAEVRLSLRECLTLALRANPALQAQRIQPQISQQQLEEQRGVYGLTAGAQARLEQNLSPTNTSFISGTSVLNQLRQSQSLFLDQQLASGGVLRLELENNLLNTNSSRADLNPAFTPQLALNVSHPLLRSALNGWRELHQRENSVRAARWSFKQQAIDTAAEVQDAYWSLVLFRERLRVQERSLKILEDLLILNQEKMKAGFMSRIDLLQTEANIASRRANLLEVSRNLENTQDRLKQLLNPEQNSTQIAWDSDLIPADQPLFQAYPVALESSYALAQRQRPDYLAQQLLLQNSQLQEDIATQNRLPQLNFEGRSGLQSLDGSFAGAFSKMFALQTWFWSAGLNFEIPVLGNSFEAQYQQARLQREQQEARLNSQRQQMLRDLRQAVRNVGMTARQVGATQTAKQLAEEQLKAQTEKLNLGLTTNFQVLQFQSDFEAASLSEVNAIIEHIRAVNQLQRAEGQLLEALGVPWENP